MCVCVCVWKIKNPVGTNSDGTKKQVSSAEGTFSLDLISSIKYQALDGPQKGSCTNNTFLLGPKYPICLPWIPLTP